MNNQYNEATSLMLAALKEEIGDERYAELERSEKRIASRNLAINTLCPGRKCPGCDRIIASTRAWVISVAATGPVALEALCIACSRLDARIRREEP